MYINMSEGTFLAYDLSWETIRIDLMVMPLVTLLLLSIIPVCTTANIMLANNICDVEKDIAVKRYTLPYYLGSKSIILFAALYYMTYIAVIAMVLFGMLSPVCLLSLLTFFPVQKNINIFVKKQEKATTFMTAIKNYIIIMGTNTALIFISSYLQI